MKGFLADFKASEGNPGSRGRSPTEKRPVAAARCVFLKKMTFLLQFAGSSLHLASEKTHTFFAKRSWLQRKALFSCFSSLFLTGAIILVMVAPRGTQERTKSDQERPKSAPRATETAQRPPKSAPRATKSTQRANQERPRCPRALQDGTKSAFRNIASRCSKTTFSTVTGSQKVPKELQERTKSAQERTKSAPSALKGARRGHQERPNAPKDRQRAPQEHSKSAPRELKESQSGPKELRILTQRRPKGSKGAPRDPSDPKGSPRDPKETPRASQVTPTRANAAPKMLQSTRK